MTRPAPAALVAERVYRLAASIELDGRVSWAPAKARGTLPVNAYLVREGTRNLLVDTGIASHEDQVLEQLGRLLVPGSPLSVFLTRAEFDAFGNIGRIAEEYEVEALFTGGVSNPFDAFDFVTLAGRRPAAKIEIARQPPGFGIELSPDRRLEVLAPALRILATYWLFDARTGVLFTSDSFGHVWPGAPASVDAAARDHLLAKFGWLRGADLEKIVASLDDVFRDRPITTIAPGHGEIIEGAAAVARHYQALRSALSGLAQDAVTS